MDRKGIVLSGAATQVCVVAAVLLFGVLPVKAQAPTGSTRPPTVSAEYLATPFGYFHPSCIGRLMPGDVLRPGELAISHADGSLDSVPVCSHPHYDRKGNIVADRPNTREPDPKLPPII